MDTQQMILELRHLEEAHKNDRVFTFDTNWSLLCHDVADRLEELTKELEAAKKEKDALHEECMRLLGDIDALVDENSLRARLVSMYMPRSDSVFDYNSGYNSAIDDVFSYLNGEEI